MGEEYSAPELDVLDAESVLYGLEPQLNLLLRDRSTRYVTYPYSDRNNQVSVVHVTGAHLQSAAPQYIVAHQNEQYLLVAEHSVDNIVAPKIRQSHISVRRYSPDDKFYLQPDEIDMLRAGELLSQLDVQEMQKAASDTLRQRKEASGRKIFELFRRKR
jgi:hypothetical protein